MACAALQELIQQLQRDVLTEVSGVEWGDIAGLGGWGPGSGARPAGWSGGTLPAWVSRAGGGSGAAGVQAWGAIAGLGGWRRGVAQGRAVFFRAPPSKKDLGAGRGEQPTCGTMESCEGQQALEHTPQG